jgi:integrase
MSKASSILELDTRRAKKDNKYPLKIRVAFQRTFRRYLLGIDLTKTEFASLSKAKEKKLKELWFKASLFSKKVQEIIEQLGDNFSFQNFEKKFFSTPDNSEVKNESLYDLFTAYAEKLENQGQIGSSDSYKTTRAKLEAFLKEANPFPHKINLKLCYLEDIDVEFLWRFEKHLLNQGLSRSSIGIYTRNLRRIFNVAIADKKISSDVYPFGQNKFSPPASTKAKKALPINDIEKIFNYPPSNENEAFAKDMWLFCYFANGLNIRDVALLKYENMIDDQLVFYRQKTIRSVNEAKPIYIFISLEIQEILDKWSNKKISDKTYIFDILAPGLTPRQEKQRTLYARKKINRYMGLLINLN